MQNLVELSITMPLKKKKTKTKAEMSAEGFFPMEENILHTVEKPIKDFVDERDLLKRSIEKSYSRPSVETVTLIEKPKRKSKAKYTKPSYSKSSKSKPSKTYNSSSKEKVFSPPNITLKKDGYELIITEKPQAAQKIASALGRAEKRNLQGIPYYELTRKGKEIVIGCAVGHLFTLKQNNGGSNIPIFDISWTPNFMAKKADFTKKYYDTLLKLSKGAGEITVATDYDIEGEVIGLNVVRYITGQKDANRMKFSTLTDKELNEAYENKSPSLNWGQAIAGETRHYLDWFYGINLSRALMNAIKTTGRFKIMSIGRVQGPTLNLIVNKEREIQAFKSTPYWQVFIEIDDNKNKLELKHNRDITKKSDLSKFENLKGRDALAETKKTQQKLEPNPPFNLTTLQTEAYRLHGITPSRTLQIAQGLYLNGLISYPRTSSQKLPDSIAYKEILEKLSRKYHVESLIKRQKPIEGKKSDPAHPSIYPTGNEMILSGEDEKIYNLIVKRFLSLFCEDAIIDNKTVSATVDNLVFNTKGSSIVRKAWLSIYPIKIDERNIPDMNGKVKITKVKNEEKMTQPPHRFSPASIVSELEKRNLGTKATRSAILETLYDRGYVKEKSIEATALGISLISTLEKYSPIIIDEKLTRQFEKEMQEIETSKKTEHALQKEKKVIEEAKQTITLISKDFEKNQNKIGKELIGAQDELIAQQKIENVLVQCPICKKGNLAITYSRKTRRNFIACDAYPNCKTTFSLPPNGVIKKVNKLCEKCNFPMLMRLQKGKKPWIFCFNPKCETNKEWQEKREKTIEENKIEDKI